VLFLIMCVYQIDKLNCMNYNTCSIRLHMLLMRNEFWGVVDRFKPNPRASNIAWHIAWKLKDCKAQVNKIIHYNDL
jgi:hypothetical protein